MRGVVSQEFDAVIRISRYDLDAGVVLDVTCQIPQLAVDTNGNRVARETLADALGNLGAASGRVELLLGAVR